MSITTSSWGREQQINRFPAAAGSSGSGSYFTLHRPGYQPALAGLANSSPVRGLVVHVSAANRNAAPAADGTE